jgi:hypothetical protein
MRAPLWPAELSRRGQSVPDWFTLPSAAREIRTHTAEGLDLVPPTEIGLERHGAADPIRTGDLLRGGEMLAALENRAWWLPPEPNRDLPGFNRVLFPLS